MLYVERDDKGTIVAIRQGSDQEPGQVPASLLDAEVLAFLRSSSAQEPLTHLLLHSDVSIIRVLEDLIDLLIAKKIILFTELPPQAQEKIQDRKRLRAKMAGNPLMVDDIL
jgi:hypothetical protein